VLDAHRPDGIGDGTERELPAPLAHERTDGGEEDLLLLVEVRLEVGLEHLDERSHVGELGVAATVDVLDLERQRGEERELLTEVGVMGGHDVVGEGGRWQRRPVVVGRARQGVDLAGEGRGVDADVLRGFGERAVPAAAVVDAGPLEHTGGGRGACDEITE
jgi:hypothetical protein